MPDAGNAGPSSCEPPAVAPLSGTSPSANGVPRPLRASPRGASAAVPDFLEQLQKIELCETIRTLGTGSTGTVYLMRRSDGAQVVQKRIPVSHMSAADQEVTEREVNILATLDHPFVIRYERAYVTQGSLVIVMEHASGGDLAKHLAGLREAGSRLPLETALEWSVQLLLALKYVHSLRVLHRDIGPKNIFIMADGVVKLGDFGVSKVLDSTADFAITKVGTPCYSTPACGSNPRLAPAAPASATHALGWPCRRSLARAVRGQAVLVRERRVGRGLCAARARGEAGGKCCLPWLKTPPRVPPWTFSRLGPLPRTPERRLSRLEARRGLRSASQAAPQTSGLLARPGDHAPRLPRRRHPAARAQGGATSPDPPRSPLDLDSHPTPLSP